MEGPRNGACISNRGQRGGYPQRSTTAASATVTTKEDTTYTFAAGNFSLSDTDIGDTV